MLCFNKTRFILLIAMPVLSGSLTHLPFGGLTDKFGGCIVFFLVMVSPIIPIYLISYGTEYWHYLVTGLLLLPIMFGVSVDLTSISSSSFMLMPDIVRVLLMRVY